MNKYTFIIILLMFTFIYGQVSENYTIKSSSFTSCGGNSLSANYSLQDAVGQSTPVGLLTSSNYFLEAGFLHSQVSSPNAIDDIIEIPEKFQLEKNYPNPFNPTTTIQFQLPKNEVVKIELYNLVGKKIQTLINNHYEAGIHQVIMDASQLASGTYFYTIKAGENFATGKCLLLK